MWLATSISWPPGKAVICPAIGAATGRVLQPTLGSMQSASVPEARAILSLPNRMLSLVNLPPCSTALGIAFLDDGLNRTVGSSDELDGSRRSHVGGANRRSGGEDIAESHADRKDRGCPCCSSPHRLELIVPLPLMSNCGLVKLPPA